MQSNFFPELVGSDGVGSGEVCFCSGQVCMFPQLSPEHLESALLSAVGSSCCVFELDGEQLVL